MEWGSGLPLPDWAVSFGEAVIVFALAYVIQRLLARLLADRMRKRFDRQSLSRTAMRAIRVGIFAFAVLIVLDSYGFNLADFTLSVAVFSAVVGVILAPIVGSLISGVFLLADQPYEIGDMVEIQDTGQRGFVEDITLRHTKIFTLDNTFIVVPNGTIRERDVINYSAEDARTRQTIDVVVTYESDLDRARKLLVRVARRTDAVIEGGPDIRIGAARYPSEPVVLLEEFGDHGIGLRLRYWIEQPYRLNAIKSSIQTAYEDAIQDEPVAIAYPHSHLVFDDTSGSLTIDRDGIGSSGRAGGERTGDAGTDAATDVETDGGAGGNVDGTTDPVSGGEADPEAGSGTDGTDDSEPSVGS
ncbi:mechanosensitive ion channel family protein [Halococcoides cellulosivorans]|uniref:Mechanosensitive ion channel family protein n=2 Tax=Halococcoides cellulosivorans TaxID=1679096 RepID=A0A2R4X4B1_9EURY|nr:mechanosensitive ion channel family protein [Halococcoides cellulosivorans]